MYTDKLCRSKSASETKASLPSMPQEILNKIAGHLPPEDNWTLRMICRTMAKKIEPVIHTESSWSTFQRVYESSVRTRPLTSRGCHICRRARFIAQFSDDQRNVKKVPEAACIPCRTKRGHYDFARFRVNGVECWVCFGCEVAKPICQVQPRRLEYSEKRWCPECWDKGIHQTLPRTRYPGGDW